MISILSSDAADKIIQLEKDCGFPEEGDGKVWASEIRQKIEDIRERVKRIWADSPGLKNIGNTVGLGFSDTLYGQGGFHRYDVTPVGNLAFLQSFAVERSDIEKARAHDFVIL